METKKVEFNFPVNLIEQLSGVENPQAFVISCVEKELHFMKQQERFKFWLENQLSKEYELNETGLKTEFNIWLQSRTLAFIEHTEISTLIRFFTGEKNGLNSTTEFETYERMELILKPERDNFLKTLKQKNDEN